MNTPTARRIDSLVAVAEIALEAEHAIKNPLATMVLAVGRIERCADAGGVPDSMATAVKHLNDAVASLGTSMERYRDASSWFRLELRDVELARVLDTVSRIAGFTTGADIRVEIRGEIPRMRLDVDFMHRALLGLAWHAIGDPPAEGGIAVGAECDPAVEGGVLIRIGGGDPTANDERLLRPFKHVIPGRFDLGLARRIIELHHGSLQLGESGGRIAARVALPPAVAQRLTPERRA